MSKQVQCHLTTPSTTGEINKVEWVDEAIKPKADMVIPFKGDSRIWTVRTAYNTVKDDAAGAYTGSRA